MHAGAQARWEEEAVAWQALCTDAWAAADTTRGRTAKIEAQREAAERAVGELGRALDATRNEVARLHSVQSGLEAQRLQDTENASAETRWMMVEELEARARESAGIMERTAAEEELAVHREETVQSEASQWEWRQRRLLLEQEIADARRGAGVLRAECAEARDRCHGAVVRLDDTERRLYEASSIPASGEPREPVASQAVVLQPVGERLAEELEQQSRRAGKLEAANQRLQEWRREEAESRWVSIERLRNKVRRYRASCTELRRLTCDSEGGELSMYSR